MRFHHARQVIHDAFMSDVTSIDASDGIVNFGVQFSARGATNRIMDHCEKGIIQQALAVQKITDKTAWAWNMFAYAPPGVCAGFERSHLLGWMHERHKKHQRGDLLLTSALSNLARVAMQDVAREDRTGKRWRRRHAELCVVVGVDVDDYLEHWHRHYIQFRGYLQSLPERSLPPIAGVVSLMNAKASGSETAAADLRRALKMPEGSE